MYDFEMHFSAEWFPFTILTTEYSESHVSFCDWFIERTYTEVPLMSSIRTRPLYCEFISLSQLRARLWLKRLFYSVAWRSEKNAITTIWSRSCKKMSLSYNCEKVFAPNGFVLFLPFFPMLKCFWWSLYSTKITWVNKKFGFLIREQVFHQKWPLWRKSLKSPKS